MPKENIVVVTSYYYLLLLTVTRLETTRKKRRYRRYSVAPVNRLRKEQGLFNNFLRFVYHNDTERFFKYTRMTQSQFDTLLKLLKPFLLKRATVKTIEAPHRLLITLHYLSEGCSMLEIAVGHRIGHATVSKIIKETTKILWEVLNPIYLKPPGKENWEKISNGFFKKWNMPNNIGAIDGKHIHIQAPNIVLMAACDAFYRFTLVDIGAAGSNHDSVIFRESGFGHNILKNKMVLPADKALPNTNVSIPYFFTADQAFPLHDRLMRPYPDRQLTQDKRIFNYRLSRARRGSVLSNKKVNCRTTEINCSSIVNFNQQIIYKEHKRAKIIKSWVILRVVDVDIVGRYFSLIATIMRSEKKY
ncbi:hypothetical protein RN001_012425 [Aquatica leii]|uniref:DDE Tnp4 domain-containing protein n=1 Tax=Aquatica leii TaxID=1421715 RepID=A0AAN7QEV1_9COLE|nr:hypothetical protein RN001_012425 [Aquatica leii]